jgi:CheY-like chemotaxis protein
MGKLEKTNPAVNPLQEVRKAAARSVELTRQLLGFARSQSISPRTLVLNDIINNCEKMLRRIIGEDIQFDLVLGDDLWPILMDPSQIEQILMNLAVNARDAIKGVGTINIETSNVFIDDAYCRQHDGFKAGQYVLMDFYDSGSGIDPKILGHVFEPFFTTKEEGQGTGLGLSTVYGIVKQNHGYINIYSESGTGTTFKMYLPRHEGPRKDATPGTETSGPLNGTETILVVEDEQKVLKMVKAMLEDAGYTVLAASDVQEALAVTGKYPRRIHILLTDIIMPKINGKELAKQIVSKRPGIKVLFMSGYSAKVISDRNIIPKGAHFLKKPFSRTLLTHTLREILDTGMKGN